MADTIAHYLDSIETGRFPDLGLHSPMYLIASKDMDGDWNNTGGQRPTKRICEYGDTIYEELPIGRFMLGVGRITSRSDAYAKCGSNDQDAFVTVREAELSNAAESLAIERSDLPVGIAKGALLPPKSWRRTSVPSAIASVMRRPNTYLYLACLPHPQSWRQRCERAFPSTRRGGLCATLSPPPRPASQGGPQCYLERRQRLPRRLLCRT